MRDPFRFSTGETALTWIWPVHTGEALGAKGRFIWFLSGFGVCFLYVSGVLRWLHRRGKVQDRPVNWARFKALGQRALKTVYLSVVKLHRVSEIAIKTALPYIKLAGIRLLHGYYRLRAAWLNRQKRIDKF